MALTLLLAGDVMTGRGIDQILPYSCPPDLYEPYVKSALGYVALAERAHGPIPRLEDEPDGWAYVWGDALEAFHEPATDLRIINLETAVTLAREPAPKGINYRMHPENVPVLTTARIDACVLANNHVLDWGVAGLQETLDTLGEASLATPGAGRSLAEARAPVSLRTGPEHRVLLLAMGVGDSGIPPGWAATGTRPGVWRLPDLSADTADRVGEVVEGARRPGDVVLASIHWGGNWGYDVPPEHRRFARDLVDRAGVDLVHGHSSHHPRAAEVYRDRLILYGCGDLLNDYEGIGGREEYRSELTLLYRVRLSPATGVLEALELLPYEVRRFRLNRPEEAAVEWLRERLDREYGRFGGGVRRRGDRLVLVSTRG